MKALFIPSVLLECCTRLYASVHCKPDLTGLGAVQNFKYVCLEMFCIYGPERKIKQAYCIFMNYNPDALNQYIGTQCSALRNVISRVT